MSDIKTLTVRLWIIWKQQRKFCDLVANVFYTNGSMDLEHNRETSEAVLKLMHVLADGVHSDPGDVVPIKAELMVEVGADMLESNCTFSVMCTETGNYVDDVEIEKSLSREVKGSLRAAIVAGDRLSG